MHFYILTLFPEMIEHVLSTSIIGRAVQNGYLHIQAVNIRDFTADKHKKVDDYPYGGGAGMVMQAQPVYDAWRFVCTQIGFVPARPRTIYLTPQAPVFSQGMAKELAREDHLVFLCGHYARRDRYRLCVHRRLCLNRRRAAGDGDGRRDCQDGAGSAEK